MRNYVIINGVDSLTINGLAINELPPISKPPMRTLQEEIDGRDGDIITNLGYGSYDKIMTIGLYNGYDIDEIIAFFNGEGTIIFSNEPDKYYNYKIIEQIDYESLIKFRTATVTFHCQPFKYPVEEEPIEVDYDYIEEEGEDLTLEPTDGSPLSLTLKGNTSQYTTTGKNLLELSLATIKSLNTSGTWNNNVYTLNNVTFTINDDYTIKVNGTANANTTLTLTSQIINSYNSKTLNGCPSDGSSNTYRLYCDLVNEQGQYISNANDYGSGVSIDTSPKIQFFILVKSGTNASNLIFKPMVSTSGGDYEPYTGGNPAPNPSYSEPVNVVTGDNTIEICGKNLFDKSSTPIYYDSSMQYTETDTGCKLRTSSSGNGFVLIDLGDIKQYENKSLTFSMSNAPSSLYQYIAFIGCNNTCGDRLTIGSALGSSSNTLTVSVGSGYTQTRLTIRLYINGGTANTDYELNNIMINYGSSASPYEAYQSQTYPIYLGVENLFDKNNITTGSFYVAGGTSSSDNWALETIPAKPNTQYYLSGNNYNNNVARIVLLDSSKSYLQDLGGYHDTHLITTSSTTAYIGLSVAIYSGSSDLDTLQLTKGTTPQHISTTPIELCKIGDYQDKILKSTGKNLMPNTQTTQTINGVTLTNIGGSYKISGTATAQVIFQINPLLSDLGLVNGETYTYSANQTLPSGATTRLEIYNNNSWKRVFVSDLNTNIQYRTATLNTTDGNILRQSIIITSGTSVNINNLELMLEKGSQKTDYEPYGIQWYIHKEIGKVVLDGSENWYRWTTNTFYIAKLSDIRNALSNYYTYNSTVSGGGQLSNGEFMIHDSLNNNVVIFKNSGVTDSTDAFKEWLSTHNTIVYYVLATPTNTIITDTTLISQLDNIRGAMSYTGQTNIMQVPYDKPFIIKARTMEGGSDEAIINNIGNTYAKPTIDIEGNGIVNVYLNGNQIFAVNVTDEVVIDSTNLEAYNPNTSALENRKVTGNIANLKLNTGTSTLKFSGNLTKATITDYVRYL